MLLAIDTATDWAGIALYDEGEATVRLEETWWARRRHTTTLMPRIDRAMSDVGLSPEALSAVAVAIGPGSYTGLRVGLSLAKGLALARRIPILGIPTLDIVAYPYRWGSHTTCAIIQAGRTRVCWALYPSGGDLRPLSGYHLDDVPTLIGRLQSVQGALYVVGELTPVMVEAFRTELGEHVRVGTPAEGLRRAGFLAEMGKDALAAGRADDPATLSPIYLRHPGSTAP